MKKYIITSEVVYDSDYTIIQDGGHYYLCTVDDLDTAIGEFTTEQGARNYIEYLHSEKESPEHVYRVKSPYGYVTTVAKSENKAKANALYRINDYCREHRLQYVFKADLVTKDFGAKHTLEFSNRTENIVVKPNPHLRDGDRLR